MYNTKKYLKLLGVGALVSTMFIVTACHDGNGDDRISQSSAYSQTDKTSSTENVNKSDTKKVTKTKKTNKKPFWCKKAKFKKMTSKYRRYCK